MNHADVLIIGAGISGLLCATELQRAGLTVRVVDKGRGFGGRMATRRMGAGRFDHGAQFFTVRDSRLQAYVSEWISSGVIKEWFRHSPEDTNPDGYSRYCGLNGMTDVPKHLAAGLDTVRGERIIELSRNIDTWVATAESGALFTAHYLVVSAPLPQALALLDTTGLTYAGEDETALRRVRYAKGLATLALLDGPSALEGKGFAKVLDSPLAWVADNQTKGISPDVCAVTIHADAAFAEKHWDSADELRGPIMLDAAKSYLGSRVIEYSCHRWGFTTPLNPWHEKQFTNQALRLTLAGDAFGGARVEGAALSGIEAAQAVYQNCGISLRGS
ncbi:MAG: FAD-dependent oxidoreductase [Verrucomicrobiota bacterium]